MIKITPLDTLFFRDGRPFTSGDDNWAYNIFPPLPSTVYGAMRTAYIAQRGGLSAFMQGEMKDAIGTADGPGAFAIRGVFVVQGYNLLVPAPLDTLIHRHKNGKRLGVLRLEEGIGPMIDNLWLSHRLNEPGWEEVEIPDKVFIEQFTLKDYLSGGKGPFTFVRQNELIKREDKIGIERSRQTHTAAEGMLYQAGMLRLVNNVALAADYTGLDDFPQSGIMRLGGEAKAARYEEAPQFGQLGLGPDELRKLWKADSVIKLYLATPAIFKKGWLPEGIDEMTGIWEIDGISLRLLTAAVASPINVGGWDLAHRRPKPMHKAVPAGSVYYFKVEKGDIESVIKKFNNKNISDVNSEQGFGLAFMGVVS